MKGLLTVRQYAEMEARLTQTEVRTSRIYNRIKRGTLKAVKRDGLTYVLYLKDKTIKKIEIIPVFVELIPEQLIQNEIYISEKYGCSVHSCLCGCGEKAVMPLNPKFSSSWNLIEDRGMISFTPSILNTNCPNKYHYVISNNIANVI